MNTEGSAVEKTWKQKMDARRAAGLDMSHETLLELARTHVMSHEERLEQRRSWVIGELMLEHPDMTREEALERVLRAERSSMK